MTDGSFDEMLGQYWWRKSVEDRVQRWLVKLKNCAQYLKLWGSKTFGNISRQIKDVQKELEDLNKCPRLGEVRSSITRVENELNRLLALDEYYWRQRARVEWLRSGDRNTKIFHSKVSTFQEEQNSRVRKS